MESAYVYHQRHETHVNKYAVIRNEGQINNNELVINPQTESTNTSTCQGTGSSNF